MLLDAAFAKFEDALNSNTLDKYSLRNVCIHSIITYGSELIGNHHSAIVCQHFEGNVATISAKGLFR